MPAGLAPLARTLHYRAITRLTPQRLDRARRARLGRVALGAAQRLAGDGPLVVAHGPAKGLQLSAGAVALTHFQAYGIVRGLLEIPVQEALRRAVAPGAVVFDVGANVGFFSLLAARLTGPAGAVHAFEPSPESAAAIAEHARLNALANVVVHQVAVGERSGEGQLLHVDERAWSHLADRGWHDRTEQVLPVDLVALDDLVRDGRVPPPSVVKIDVEGSELAVLAGMRELLGTAGPTLVCELHETNRELVAVLAEADYVVENLDGAHAVESAGAVHALARPRNR